MRAGLSLAAAAALFVFPRPALAVDCSGTVDSSIVYYEGSVIVRGSWLNDYTQICNLNSEWKGITPSTCASWKAMADAAVSLGRTMILHYTGSVTCSTLPRYSEAPAPFYVALL